MSVTILDKIKAYKLQEVAADKAGTARHEHARRSVVVLFEEKAKVNVGKKAKANVAKS